MQGLNDLLCENAIKLHYSVSDWREAVRIGGEMLVTAGASEQRYIDAMIHIAEDLGPYIVMAPGLAIAHARPEDGVIQTAFSLLTLDEPVEFGNEFNDPVYVVFCMAAKDHDAHIGALQQVAVLCSDDENFEKIKSAKQVSEILDLIKTVELS